MARTQASIKERLDKDLGAIFSNTHVMSLPNQWSQAVRAVYLVEIGEEERKLRQAVKSHNKCCYKPTFCFPICLTPVIRQGCNKACLILCCYPFEFISQILYYFVQIPVGFVVELSFLLIFRMLVFIINCGRCFGYKISNEMKQLLHPPSFPCCCCQPAKIIADIDAAFKRKYPNKILIEVQIYGHHAYYFKPPFESVLKDLNSKFTNFMLMEPSYAEFKWLQKMNQTERQIAAAEHGVTSMPDEIDATTFLQNFLLEDAQETGNEKVPV